MNDRKTIWYITKYFSPSTKNSPGGRAWFLMKELATSGYNSVVITSDSNNLVDVPALEQSVTYEEVEGVQIVWLKTLKYGVAKSITRILSWFHFEWNLLRLSKKKLAKPDAIVISSLSLLTIFNGLLLRRKYKCRLIFEVRDIWPLTIIHESGVSPKNPFVILLSWTERLAYKQADAVIGTMPNLEEHVRKVSKSTTPVYCIPMGVAKEQSEVSTPLEPEYIKQYLSSDAMKIVHAGTIGITNALDIFFQAASKLQNRNDIEFILVGDGALRNTYIQKYGSLPNVIFAPKVNRYQVPSVLQLADIVYFSTFPTEVWKYGQSLNKIIDYMLSGTPILASYSGYPSMINEANCGFFIPAGDVDALVNKITKLAEYSEEELNTMGKNGRDWLLANRSYTKLAKEFAQVILDND